MYIRIAMLPVTVKVHINVYEYMNMKSDARFPLSPALCHLSLPLYSHSYLPYHLVSHSNLRNSQDSHAFISFYK